jgi:putative FmdB family regulatory protein
MPTYDYHCKKCEKKFEILQKMNDAPLTKCESCGSEQLQRGFGGGLGISFREEGIPQQSQAPSGSGCCPCGKNQNSCSK